MSSYATSENYGSSKFNIDMDLQMGAIEEENYDEDDNEQNAKNYQDRLDILNADRESKTELANEIKQTFLEKEEQAIEGHKYPFQDYKVSFCVKNLGYCFTVAKKKQYFE